MPPRSKPSYRTRTGLSSVKALVAALEERDVAVWFDTVSIQPGKSQSLQMDAGLRKAEYSGILPDLAGFTTKDDSMESIADKVVPAVQRSSA